MATTNRSSTRSTNRSKSTSGTTQPKRVVTTSAGNVRLNAQRTKSQRKPRVRYVAAELPVPGSGFVGFLRERAVIGLAVGFVVATQMQALAKQLIASFVDPLTKFVFSQKLSEQAFVVHRNGEAVNFMWGKFVYELIYFLFVIFAIYVIIKFFKLDKLDKKQD